MAGMMDLLVQQLGSAAVDQISRQVGGDRKATSRAVTGAIPILLKAMSSNASSQSGAAALAGALSRDHDGGVLDNLAGFLNAPDERAGNGILGHLLGA